MSKTSQTVVVPHIEENIPLPKNAKEALPEMTVAEEINARTNTIKMLSDITDEVIEPTTEDIEKAESLAKEMGEKARETVVEKFAEKKFVEEWNMIFNAVSKVPYTGRFK